MNRLYICKSSVLFIFMTVGIATLIFLARPVLAQEPSPTPAAEATDVPLSEDDAAAPVTPASELLPFIKSVEFYKLALTTLITALVMWGILFLYTSYIHTRYYATTVDLSKRGYSVTPFVVANDTFSEVGDLSTKFKIKGSRTVTVGVQSDEYELMSKDQEVERDTVKWIVHPENAAIVDPVQGPTTKVTAAMSGAFTLKATVPNITDPVLFSIAAVAPQATKEIDLPVFGRGYGTIAIAIVILAIVLILGLSTILPGAAIATLLGTLAGYIFSKAVPARSNGNDASEPPSTEEDQ